MKAAFARLGVFVYICGKMKSYMIDPKILAAQIALLPEEQKTEVWDFIAFLLSKGQRDNAPAASVPSLAQALPYRRAGVLPQLVAYMADDFNEPLDDFQDYMPTSE